MKSAFNLDTVSMDKARIVVNNFSRALVKKRYSCLDQNILIRLTTQIFTVYNRYLRYIYIKFKSMRTEAT